MSNPFDPVIILVEPQLGENIGAAARAMLNCGLTRMRIVRPRDGWPNERALAAASGADAVIQGAEIFDSTSAAIADLNFVLATTARQRDMVKIVLTPEAAAEELHARAAVEHRTGILFGPERTGLMNDDIPLADAVVTIPVNPAFSSLNLAQQVDGVRTGLNGGALTLNPAPTNGAFDVGVDGTVTVIRPVSGATSLKAKTTTSALSVDSTASATQEASSAALNQFWSLEGQKQDDPTHLADTLTASTDEWEALAWTLSANGKSSQSRM